MNISYLDVLVKVAFVAIAAHFVGVAQPGMVAQIPLLPWQTICLVSVSIAALFSAFHGLARNLFWLVGILGVIALVLASILTAVIIQFGPEEKSNRAFNAVASVGNALFALVFKYV